MTAKVIPFPVDVHGLLREDILACLRQHDLDGSKGFERGADEMARWLLRPEGAVRRLVAINESAHPTHPGQQNLLDGQTSMFEPKEGA